MFYRSSQQQVLPRIEKREGVLSAPAEDKRWDGIRACVTGDSPEERPELNVCLIAIDLITI
jgi:hypothetical protein